MNQPGNRVVVITGAASGIGHATAELFRDLGDTVLGLDIRDTVPDGVTYVECNVGDKAAVDAAIEQCAVHGRIDVLANVAGIVQFGRIESVTEEEWDRVHAVDLKGPFFLIQAALPHLRACGGTVVNVSSVAGNVAQPYATAYAAAKGGLTHLTRSLALELSPEGIRVNLVSAGPIRTTAAKSIPGFESMEGGWPERAPLGWDVTDPEPTARAVAALLSDWFPATTGEIVHVDGGVHAMGQ